jgi:SAM-dependent methyltransferase
MTSSTEDADPPWAKRRLSFGGFADRYDQWRPEYPPEALAWMVAPAAHHNSRASAPLRVVDLASGTGRLAAVALGLGHDVLAVEPDDDMRAVAERVAPGRTLRGTAEDIPLDDGWADAVVVGQAYHWFEPDRALPEIARVLRPGGVLGLVWNIRDDSEAWVAELSAFAGGVDRSSHRPRTVDLGSLYSPVEQAEFRHAQQLDADGLVGLVSSWSYIALRADRDAMLDRVRGLALTHPDLAGRPAFELPYVTRAYRATAQTLRS